MQKIINLLISKNLTIASCESITGGLFSSEVTSISGASKVFRGGLITYQNLAKERLLDISEDFIKEYGVISKETANIMAKKVSELFASDIGISFTGNAGPSVLENKPVGMVYSTIYFKKEYHSYIDELSGLRNEIRAQCVKLMCERLDDLIRNC